jgi:hypothetical protein
LLIITEKIKTIKDKRYKLKDEFRLFNNFLVV